MTYIENNLASTQAHMDELEDNMEKLRLPQPFYDITLNLYWYPPMPLKRQAQHRVMYCNFQQYLDKVKAVW